MFEIYLKLFNFNYIFYSGKENMDERSQALKTFNSKENSRG